MYILVMCILVFVIAVMGDEHLALLVNHKTYELTATSLVS